MQDIYSIFFKNPGTLELRGIKFDDCTPIPLELVEKFSPENNRITIKRGVSIKKGADTIVIEGPDSCIRAFISKSQVEKIELTFLEPRIK